MNTTTPDPATLRALSTSRKQDRAEMIRIIKDICNHPGIVADVKEHNRSVSINIATDSGLCAMACISGKFLPEFHWFMHHEAKGTINPSFTYSINMSHHRKATKVCAGFMNVCEHLETCITKIRSGEAVIMPPTPTLTPQTTNTNPTNMQTLQSNPTANARKATTTRDDITYLTTRLRHLFKSDNDAPRLFAEQFGDVLTEHGWNDPLTAAHYDEEFSNLQIAHDELKEQLAELTA